MKSRLFWFLLSGALVWFSCREQAESPPLTFTSTALERQGGPDCSTEEGRCVRLEMGYPLAAGPQDRLVATINDTLQQTLIETLLMLNPDADSTDDLQLLADRFVESYTQFIQDAPAYELGWWIETSYEIHRNTSKLVSIELMVSAYTGGAHPLGFSETFNLAVPGGEPVKLDDLILDREGFMSLVEKEFKASRGFPETASLQEEGFFYDGPFALPPNFVFTAEGLYLIYNVYDVAPYALGPTEILIPYARLEGLLELNRIL
ncbi:MAG: DUF3298 and DUF4163 domain-containing protein [Lewinellaceae bacterium]|nr:DUF3298 and DUF4163 domain-containing protein [Lewinellaceae bacterium]